MLVEWFRLWLFPPAPPTDARLTDAPPSPDGMTPLVTDEDIPADRRAIMLGIQKRQHGLLNRISGPYARQQMAERRQVKEPPT